jgi:hypothetical protein
MSIPLLTTQSSSSQPIGPPTESLQASTEDLRPPTEDLRPPTKDLRPPIEDLRPPTEDLGLSSESDGPSTGCKSDSIMNPSVVFRRVGTVTSIVVGSSLCRKVLYMGGLYYVGGSLISIFGLGPVVATGLLIWMI